jgi:hypothetical protein
MAGELNEVSFSYHAPFDGPAVRFSMADAHGGEHWQLRSVTGSKSLRKVREEALDEIAGHIERGLPPGEVIVRKRPDA